MHGGDGDGMTQNAAFSEPLHVAISGREVPVYDMIELLIDSGLSLECKVLCRPSYYAVKVLSVCIRIHSLALVLYMNISLCAMCCLLFQFEIFTLTYYLPLLLLLLLFVFMACNIIIHQILLCCCRAYKKA